MTNVMTTDFNGLASVTALADGDQIIVVQYVGGTPIARRATLAQMFAFFDLGSAAGASGALAMLTTNGLAAVTQSGLAAAIQ